MRFLATALLILLCRQPVLATVVLVPGAGDFTVQAKSLKEKKFESTVRQQYDFSCGSAAVSTLLTYHLSTATPEKDIFDDMFEQGNKEKIRKDGFSLLDMKKYLNAKGFSADGYYLSIDKIAQLKLPGIVLITTKGYRHFVVVKGVTPGHVVLADPAVGVRFVSHEDFLKIWNGLFFAVRKKGITPSGFVLEAPAITRMREHALRDALPVAALLDRI